MAANHAQKQSVGNAKLPAVKCRLSELVLKTLQDSNAIMLLSLLLIRA